MHRWRRGCIVCCCVVVIVAALRCWGAWLAAQAFGVVVIVAAQAVVVIVVAMHGGSGRLSGREEKGQDSNQHADHECFLYLPENENNYQTRHQRSVGTGWDRFGFHHTATVTGLQQFRSGFLRFEDLIDRFQSSLAKNSTKTEPNRTFNHYLRLVLLL
ncbi:hypothetical protein BU15DRAFT_64775 [Melanogaster broomeanus]|nr:hypothetical protein BU15DRAFT_64775 [Melanogaster broomeanus]